MMPELGASTTTEISQTANRPGQRCRRTNKRPLNATVATILEMNRGASQFISLGRGYAATRSSGSTVLSMLNQIP
jgi:hypothetical protein